jgi:hypothetical protein
MQGVHSICGALSVAGLGTIEAIIPDGGVRLIQAGHAVGVEGKSVRAGLDAARGVTTGRKRTGRLAVILGAPSFCAFRAQSLFVMYLIEWSAAR